MARQRGSARTQAERSAQTRGALLQATVDCLVEVGYARTTTTTVVAKAGVSLGALVHHFPSKSELMTTTVTHLLERRQAEFRAQMAAVGDGPDRLGTAIDLLWTAFSGPTFVAWLELWVGGRRDPELAPAVLHMQEQFRTSSRALFAELFPPEQYADAGLDETGLVVAFAVMDGVALAALGGEEPDLTAIEVLKVLAQERIGPPRPGPA